MRWIHLVALVLLPIDVRAGPTGATPTKAAVGGNASKASATMGGPAQARPSALAVARRGFVTKVALPEPPGEPPPAPPPSIFRLVHYDAPPGKLAAYVSPDPSDGRKHPAIVWITGGDCNTIDDLWKKAPRQNDQTAAAYREAGIIMMFPSLRGGNNNPGRREGFLGEVDDVLAARDYLARQSYVDPQRIYLGGHSTGGTLVMLVAESSDRFRAVFSFGPVGDPRRYPRQLFPYDQSNAMEMKLRTPARWLDSVNSPLFVIEGTDPPVTNVMELEAMSHLSTNPSIHFVPVSTFTHFTILAPMNELIAAKILRDDGPKPHITISDAELDEMRTPP